MFFCILYLNYNFQLVNTVCKNKYVKSVPSVQSDKTCLKGQFFLSLLTCKIIRYLLFKCQQLAKFKIYMRKKWEVHLYIYVLKVPSKSHTYLVLTSTSLQLQHQQWNTPQNNKTTTRPNCEYLLFSFLFCYG